MPVAQIMGSSMIAAAAGYCAVALVAVMARRRVRRASAQACPPISVLKPLCGTDPQLLRCLRSFCEQRYPALQLVFGVASRKDPAVDVVARLRLLYPQVDMTLVIDPAAHGSNPKVSNLMNSLRHAKHDLLVLADSDIIVPCDYLARLSAELQDPGVGIVTCAYRGRPSDQLWSRLVAEFICGWFTPSVYVAALFGSRRFAFGATIALRRDVLHGIGGLEIIADDLADDYRLGELTRARGLRTVLSEVVVDTTVTEASAADMIAHQLRWLRTIRTVRPIGYSLAFFSFALPLACAGAVLLHCQASALAGVVWVLLCRLAISAVCGGERRVRNWLLVPCADVTLCLLWCWGFARRRVQWRDATFDVDVSGLAQRIDAALPGKAT